MGRDRWPKLTLVLTLSVWTSAQAEPRMVLPAPPPDAPLPTWLDNEVTRRFAVWDGLDRAWQACSRERVAPPFVREASRVCLSAASLPTEGEGTPGRRARLVQESCTAALRALPACGALTPSSQNWERSFVRVGTCGDADTLARVITLAQLEGAPPEEVEAARPYAATESRDELQAREGREALTLPLCERVSRLRALQRGLAQGPLASSFARADSEVQLERAWESRGPRGASFSDVVAYHLAEAELALLRVASEEAARSDDAAALMRARDALACLEARDDARAFRATVERRIRVLEASDVRARERSSFRYEQNPPPSDARACCRVCHKGYACGDSCISREKTCHKGPGCACDG